MSDNTAIMTQLYAATSLMTFNSPAEKIGSIFDRNLITWKQNFRKK
jgi:muramoyltetrapeptide carboxypeptidase LdcA involved in peptidoglycan recycling